MSESKPETELPKLNRRQQRFVQLYMEGIKGAECLRRMGFTGTPQQLAHRAFEMVNNPKIKAYMAARRKQEEEDYGIRREVVLRALYLAATSNVKDLYDENGQLIGIQNLTEEAAAIIAGIEVETIHAGRGEERQDIGILTKVKIKDSARNSEVLARMMGWNKDKLQIDHSNTAPPVIQVMPYPDADEAERAARAAVSGHSPAA